MFTQPVVDLIEISKFMTQSGINTVKMVRDGVKLVREGKAVGAFEKILASLKGVPKRRWAVAAAVAALAGYGISELVSDDKEINKEAEVLFAKYKNDPNGLDKALAENRSTFDQDTKNECLKYALIAKLGLSGDYAAQTEVRHEKGVYTISMPIVISKQYGGDILSSVESSLVQVEPNAQLQMEVRGQVAYAFRKEAEAQLKAEGESTEAIPRIIDEKLEAMGYNPELGKQKS